ncbi:NAD(P)-binding protein [Hyaloscypha variabilis F]|uniref:NAD(P)-binding protein n=1 Tax=Hyaloscypha variabilis (strain UAMH 11265 / GT02V1 / F) TaxID=1149755 RepID=A0A2J6S475_HYAVF|nr:NAD(P)-binding protein [Hyaloscypha variabilis F]
MTITTSNRAIWISAQNELSLRPITETYEPEGAQVLVQVEYSGINPADLKHGLHLGLNDYPSGYEYSGKVIQAGEEAKFSVGDLVLGHNLVGKNKPIYHGSHQDVLIGEHYISHVPPNMSMQEAACISIMVQTAADGLFNQLGLSGGGVLGEELDGEPILIWGGATSVGVAAIQLAKAAGLSPILTTASKHNHAGLKALGATACFDYRDADVVFQIKSAVQELGGRPLKSIFDTVGAPSSTQLCEECAENENVAFASTLPQPGRPQWKMVLATRNVNFPFPKPGGGVHMMLANPEWQARIDRAITWCLSNYGSGRGFTIPHVRVVSGADDAIAAIKFVADGRSSFEKVVIKHPL